MKGVIFAVIALIGVTTTTLALCKASKKGDGELEYTERIRLIK